MKKDLCELLVVIDESGSMQHVVDDTIGGFNQFLETHQALPGEAKLTLVKFDTKYTIVHNGVDIKDVKPLDRTTYVPGNMTSLLDAVGRTIDEVGKRLAATPENELPEKVIMLIITDGAENSSTEYTLEQVKAKTKHQQEKYNWDITFLGADQNAWRNAQAMGVSNSVDFSQNEIGKTLKATAYYSSNSRTNSANTSMLNFTMSEPELDAELLKIKNSKTAPNA